MKIDPAVYIIYLYIECVRWCVRAGVCECACVYVRMYVCLPISVRARVFVPCVSVCACVRVCVRGFACLSIHVCVPTFVHVCV